MSGHLHGAPGGDRDTGFLPNERRDGWTLTRNPGFPPGEHHHGPCGAGSRRQRSGLRPTRREPASQADAADCRRTVGEARAGTTAVPKTTREIQLSAHVGMRVRYTSGRCRRPVMSSVKQGISSMKRSGVISVLALVSIGILSACGGGSGGASTTDKITPSPKPPPPVLISPASPMRLPR